MTSAILDAEGALGVLSEVATQGGDPVRVQAAKAILQHLRHEGTGDVDLDAARELAESFLLPSEEPEPVHSPVRVVRGAKVCPGCSQPLPEGSRANRKYHDDACRKRAYRYRIKQDQSNERR